MIVTEVNCLRCEAAENEINQEAADIPNIHLHISAIGNIMSARDESTDPRPIIEHLKFLGATINALTENASVMDVSILDLAKVTLTSDEHKGYPRCLQNTNRKTPWQPRERNLFRSSGLLESFDKLGNEG